jgi:two-component system OmpR family response regulator
MNETRQQATMDEGQHILVVDDYRDIRDPLATYLKKHGFRVTTAADARAARDALLKNAIDLIVLDIMMPGEDGLALCRDVRANAGTPIIFLTAMAESADRIAGLEIGADDYVVKPFEPRELVARIKTVLRRANMLPSCARAHGGDVALTNLPKHGLRASIFLPI